MEWEAWTDPRDHIAYQRALLHELHPLTFGSSLTTPIHYDWRTISISFSPHDSLARPRANAKSRISVLWDGGILGYLQTHGHEDRVATLGLLVTFHQHRNPAALLVEGWLQEFALMVSDGSSGAWMEPHVPCSVLVHALLALVHRAPERLEPVAPLILHPLLSPSHGMMTHHPGSGVCLAWLVRFAVELFASGCEPCIRITQMPALQPWFAAVFQHAHHFTSTTTTTTSMSLSERGDDYLLRRMMGVMLGLWGALVHTPVMSAPQMEQLWGVENAYPSGWYMDALSSGAYYVPLVHTAYRSASDYGVRQRALYKAALVWSIYSRIEWSTALVPYPRVALEDLSMPVWSFCLASTTAEEARIVDVAYGHHVLSTETHYVPLSVQDTLYMRVLAALTDSAAPLDAAWATALASCSRAFLDAFPALPQDPSGAPPVRVLFPTPDLACVLHHLQSLDPSVPFQCIMSHQWRSTLGLQISPMLSYTLSSTSEHGGQSGHIKLHQQQQRVLASVALSRLTVVIGPPGTGKTATVVACVAHLLSLMPAHGGHGGGGRILCTAHSNAAVDDMMMRLMTSGVRCNRIPQPRDSGARVDCATLYGALRLLPSSAPQSASTVGGMGYDAIVVEEAAKVLETELLPLLRLQPLQRIVLMGDDKQLPPLLMDAPPGVVAYAGYDTSLLARLRRSGARSIGLNVQARAHPRVADLYRWRYPDGGLLDHPRVHDLPMPPGLVFRTNWVHVPSSSPSSSSCSLFANAGMGREVSWEEACMAVALSVSLMGVDGHHHRPEVVVLTLYARQKALIQQMMGGDGGDSNRSGVMVYTVDEFQGKEADVVLLSLGVNLPSSAKPSAFVCAPERVNVATSRARLAVVVLGDMELMRRDGGEWARVLGCVESRGDLWVCTRGGRHVSVRTPEQLVLELEGNSNVVEEARRRGDKFLLDGT